MLYLWKCLFYIVRQSLFMAYRAQLSTKSDFSCVGCFCSSSGIWFLVVPATLDILHPDPIRIIKKGKTSKQQLNYSPV